MLERIPRELEDARNSAYTLMRIQFEFSDERVTALEAMMREAQISTRKDFFINALTLFEWAIKECKAGRRIACFDKDDLNCKEFLLPAFIAVAPNPAQRE